MKWIPADPMLAELLQEHKIRTTPHAKASDWVLRQPGEWETVLAWTLAGASSRSCRGNRWDRASRLAYIFATHIRLCCERSMLTQKFSSSCCGTPTLGQP